jgi:hypothetical protein
VSQPTRVSLSLGSTSRNGGEFEFRKITLSLDRDLVPAENPIDAYRSIKSLLERMVTEFQASKPAAPAKTQQTGTVPPGLPAQKPVGLQLETVRERLEKWLQDLEIVDGFDGYSVKPKRYLDQSWRDVNEVVRSLGGHWMKGVKPTDGSWRIKK